jgi:hypothetical protein
MSAGQEARGVWRAVTASETGAHHIRNGMPYEDAYAVLPETGNPPILTVAVADGHGHARHFRSSKGAQLAVEISTRLAHEIASETDPEHLDGVLRTRIGPGLVRAWREAVERDIHEHPITAVEQAKGGLTPNADMDDKVFAYGSTVIVAIATDMWLMCAQIGDGDILAVTSTGRAIRLVPDDPRLDGWRTTSLCQPDAVDALRYGAIRLDGSDISAVMLATDGYANAQARTDWDTVFAADLDALTDAHGIDWIANALPRWVAACASADGSGDDVTVALLFRTTSDVSAETGAAS